MGNGGFIGQGGAFQCAQAAVVAIGVRLAKGAGQPVLVVVADGVIGQRAVVVLLRQTPNVAKRIVPIQEVEAVLGAIRRPHLNLLQAAVGVVGGAGPRAVALGAVEVAASREAQPRQPPFSVVDRAVHQRAAYAAAQGAVHAAAVVADGGHIAVGVGGLAQPLVRVVTVRSGVAARCAPADGHLGTSQQTQAVVGQVFLIRTVGILDLRQAAAAAVGRTVAAIIGVGDAEIGRTNQL